MSQQRRRDRWHGQSRKPRWYWERTKSSVWSIVGRSRFFFFSFQESSSSDLRFHNTGLFLTFHYFFFFIIWPISGRGSIESLFAFRSSWRLSVVINQTSGGPPRAREITCKRERTQSRGRYPAVWWVVSLLAGRGFFVYVVRSFRRNIVLLLFVFLLKKKTGV